jgi:hypothetical protein
MPPDDQQIRTPRPLHQMLGVALHGQVLLLPFQEHLNAVIGQQGQLNSRGP